MSRKKSKRKRPIHRPQRGDLYYADLDPVVGSEQGGVRPVVVIQNNTGNHHSPTLVAAITSRRKPTLPTHVPIGAAECGLEEDSCVLLEQFRTLDRMRFRAYIGRLAPESIAKINEALALSVGLRESA